jgi:hydrogenase/urease accessory protein HupE
VIGDWPALARRPFFCTIARRGLHSEFCTLHSEFCILNLHYTPAVRPAALLLLLTLAAAKAEAHPAPFSYLDLHVGDDGVRGELVLHVVDVAHDLGIDAERLLDPSVAVAERDRIVDLVAPRLMLRVDERAAVPEWGSIAPAGDRHAVALGFRVAGARPGTVTVRARMFPYDPFHQTFVNIYEDGSLRQQAVFNATDGERVYYAGTVQGTFAVIRTFVPAGVHHILIGPDHILFLVGLLLLGGGWWPLLRIVTAFTIGHSITLSLAALNIVTPPATIVEPAIALSIIFVGADNLLVGTSGRDVRAWIALAFGLVHGFGFANVLREFGLPAEALGWSLFSFNLGVEIGQVLVVAVVAAALAFVRERNQAAARRLAFAGSLVVIVAGAYWFVERVFL